MKRPTLRNSSANGNATPLLTNAYAATEAERNIAVKQPKRLAAHAGLFRPSFGRISAPRPKRN